MRICCKALSKLGSMEKAFLRVVAVLLILALILVFSSCSAQTAEPKMPEAPYSLDTSVTVSKATVYEDEWIAVTAESLSFDSLYGPELLFTVENRSDHVLHVQADTVCVNGYVVSAAMGDEIGINGSKLVRMSLYQSDLEDARIQTIGTVEFTLSLVDAESSAFLAVTEPIAVSTSGDAAEDPQPDTGGTAVYAADGLHVTAQELYTEPEGFGESQRLYIENLSSRDVLIQIDSATVNGTEVWPLFSCTVPAGKRAFTAMTFFASVLSEMGITSVETIEFSLSIHDPETYRLLDSTDVISLKAS